MNSNQFPARFARSVPIFAITSAWIALCIASQSAIAASDVSTIEDMSEMKGMGNMDMPRNAPDASGHHGQPPQTEGRSEMNDMPGMKGMGHMEMPSDQPAGTSRGRSERGEQGHTGHSTGFDSSGSQIQQGGPSDGPNHIIRVAEPKIPMENRNQGIPMPGMDMADDDVYHQILLNQLEYVKAAGGQGWAWDGEAWVGGDINRLWLKSSGERLYGKTDDARVEALISHAYSTYWNAQAGWRHDFGNGPTRDWAAIGVEGLAPYFFNVQATGYIGTSGRTALQLKTSYDFLLSQKLFLTPEAEMNIYGKSDPEREIGSGISDIKLGLRLRFEVRREIAPYVGFVWGRRFGRTADFSRRDGEPVTDKELVVGVRLWY
ncbi:MULTISPECIES: copper resistance protein B [unclassified Caballeronia]|uniref:copper resistance protein B n=1 Tax=unclassified Caballeronia TaxID=2646786 RepID=UPI002864B074|nr:MULTISPECIES: copper resistance protein B [unclassified Caballeronia]MDR5751316.1 copper resistance protein B [Caballeronia sp. LZ024]MDR5844542.1 copper resistance protein B [Caballeronia sp. LZ031]